MRNGVRSAICAVFLFPLALLFATTATAQNGNEYLNSLLNAANALTHRIHDFHDTDEAAFGEAEIDYCRTMRAGSAMLRRLRIDYEYAKAAGFTAAALQIRRAAARLGEELAYEDYLDYEYGNKSWCSPTGSEPDWSYGAPPESFPYNGYTSNILRFQVGAEVEYAGSGVKADANADILNNIYFGSDSANYNANGYNLDFKAYIPYLFGAVLTQYPDNLFKGDIFVMLTQFGLC